MPTLIKAEERLARSAAIRCWRWWIIGLFSGAALAADLPAGFSRASPDTWDLWRCGPIPFPDRIVPQVPEAVAGAAIEFGAHGAALAIVEPDEIPADYDGEALRAMIRLVAAKVPRAARVRAGAATDEVRGKHLLVLGTPSSNAFVSRASGASRDDAWRGFAAGGYRVWTRDSPFAPGRRVIFALGVDAAGAWPAAALLAYSIHPAKDRLSPLKPWPVQLPDGIYWSPFAAECHGNDDTVPPPAAAVAYEHPAIPFGVRIWGSPMPTLGSYRRLISALRDLGVDTVAVQSGGWPDLADAPARFREAVEMAAQQGVGTILYVGNDLVAHRPAPLTDQLRAVVVATKDLPGLREFHVYNQLTADLTPAERALVAEQVRWLRSLTSKRIGMEIVWGHDTPAPPPDKVRLIEDLKAWGVDVIAHDDAPIGGWSRAHDVTIWEPRLQALAKFGLPTEAVLQAHVPFVEPTLPTAAAVRSQFWWAAAGGARGFLIEAAYVFTSLSNRGLLSWDLRPLPDGRAAEVRRLSEIARAITPFTATAQPVSAADARAWGVSLAPGTNATIRFYQGEAGRRFILVLNRSITAPASATLIRHAAHGEMRELAPGQTLRAAANDWAVALPAGGGACLEFLPPKS